MMKFKKIQRRYLGDGDAPPGDKPPAAPPKAFDQKAVDDIVGKKVAELTRKFEQQRAADLERMAKLETDSSAKAELEKQVEEMNARYKTKEELAADAYKKEKATWEQNYKQTTAERDSWRKRWEDQTRDAALMEAAGSKDADVRSIEQVQWFLQPKAKVVQKIVEGKAIDDYEVLVDFPTMKEGKQIVLKVPPNEAIKLMKADVKRFGNLFNTDKAGGTGGTGPQGGGGGETQMGLSTAEFNKRFLEGTLPKKVQ